MGGALLAYPVSLCLSPSWTAALPPDELTFRLAQLLALLGVWPLLKFTGGVSRVRLGLVFGTGPMGALQQFSRGFLFGLLTLGTIIVCLLLLDVRGTSEEVWTRFLGRLPRLAVSAFLSAVVVALIEEFWFRGGLHGYFAVIYRPAAFLVVPTLYGAVHFLRPTGYVPAYPMNWTTGFEVLGVGLASMFESEHVDAFVALFAAGLLLAILRHYSGSIAVCIGVHAGWVFLIKLTRKATVREEDSPLAVLISDYDGIIGWLGTVVFLAFAAICWRNRARWLFYHRVTSPQTLSQDADERDVGGR